MSSRLIVMMGALPVFALGGCASTGATFRSGVGDTFLEHAPYYADASAGDSSIAWLPIRYQRGGSHSAMFDPAGDAGTPVAALLDEMNRYLDSILTAPRLANEPLPGTPPDVHFGCETDIGGECSNGPAAPFEKGKPRMRLAIGRPSADWAAAMASNLDAAGAARTLIVTLEVGQYWPRQTNWRGSKAVELGTGYSMELPWLSSLETPLTVLQLTGALTGRDGRAVRIGAEGILARRTGIVAAGIGAQVVLTDEDVENVRTLRRTDLPGQPLAWRVALQNLVSGLTTPGGR